jgi:hypothetical protein
MHPPLQFEYLLVVVKVGGAHQKKDRHDKTRTNDWHSVSS